MENNQTVCSYVEECGGAVMADTMAQVTRAYIAVLLIVGLFGNTYCVTAFLMPEYRRVPSSLYLSALALSDIGFLLTLGLMWMRSIDLRLLDVAHICTTCMFLSYFCCFVSGWLVLAVTWERYLLSKGIGYGTFAARPTSPCGWKCWKKNDSEGGFVRRMNSHRRVRFTFAAIIIFGILMNSWVLFSVEGVMLTGRNENESLKVPVVSDAICDVSQAAAGRFYPIFNTLDMIFSFTLPFLGVLILNLKIGFRVCKAQDLARRITSVEDGRRANEIENETSLSLPTPITRSISRPRSKSDQLSIRNEPVESPLLSSDRLLEGSDPPARVSDSGNPIGRRRGSARPRRVDRKVTKLLVTVSLTYLALNLPSYVHRVVFAFERPAWSSQSSAEVIEEYFYRKPLEIIAETLAYLMFYTQFSVNFFLYSCHGCVFGCSC